MTTLDAHTMLGPVGVWANFDRLPAAELLRFARATEEMGYATIWNNESTGREPFAVLAALAGATSRTTLAVGIATIYARDAAAAHAGARTIADLSGGRFVMGLGVSHRSSAGARGHEYALPLTAMRTYLDAYDCAPWTGLPVDDPPLVIAALGPRMLELAATRSAGAFPYLVPVSYVAGARRILDEAAAGTGRPRPVLVVSQPAILGDGPDVDAAARGYVSRYLGQPNYRNNLQRAGIAEAEIDGVTAALVDLLVVTGGEDSLRERVAAMHAAGADHVAVIPLARDGSHADLETARALAPGGPAG
jgi:probable F420-dependent oxidoreductase